MKLLRIEKTKHFLSPAADLAAVVLVVGGVVWWWGGGGACSAGNSSNCLANSHWELLGNTGCAKNVHKCPNLVIIGAIGAI